MKSCQSSRRAGGEREGEIERKNIMTVQKGGGSVIHVLRRSPRIDFEYAKCSTLRPTPIITLRTSPDSKLQSAVWDRSDSI